jgi:magnesium transporter
LSLTDYEKHQSDFAQSVLGVINSKQNEMFVSVVGIPPTLVASIYGTNFRNMAQRAATAEVVRRAGDVSNQ